jgi:large subunit ribosomal protein L10
MPQEKKKETVKRIEDLLSGCTIAIVTDYRGMPVAEMAQLRRQLKESSIEYHVVKNTLASFAADNTGKTGLKSLLQGPSAIVFGYGEVTEPAKILADYARSSKIAPSIRGGLLGEQVLNSAEIAVLSVIPSKDVLIAKLAQGMQAPVMSLLTILSANLRGFITVLQARKQQLEGG